MKKLTVGVLGAGALAVVGALTISYYSGVKIQEAFEQYAADWSAEDGFSVEVLEYDRGLIRSHAKTLWSFAGEDESYEIQVTHDMLHGPWPMGKAAKVVSRFLLPPETEPPLVQALKDQAPLEWTVLGDWSGQTAHTLVSPQFSTTFQDGSSLVWGGLQAQWDLSAQSNHAKGWIQLPELRVKVEDGSSMDVEKAELNFDTTIPEDHGFWMGPSALQVGLLAVQDAETQTYFKLQQLEVSDSNTLEDAVVQSGVTVRLGQLETQAYSVDKVALDMELKNVDAAWLDELIFWTQSGSDIQNMAWLRSLPQMLARKPALSISRLTMDSADGPVALSARLAYIGDQPQAFDPGLDLEGHVQTTLPIPMFIQLLEDKVRSDYLALLEQMNHELEEEALQAAVDDGVQKRMDALLAQGVVVIEGDAVQFSLKFANGVFMLNGQPQTLQQLLSIGGAW